MDGVFGQENVQTMLGQADLQEFELALVEQGPGGVDRVDHHELRTIERDVR